MKWRLDHCFLHCRWRGQPLSPLSLAPPAPFRRVTSRTSTGCAARAPPARPVKFAARCRAVQRQRPPPPPPPPTQMFSASTLLVHAVLVTGVWPLSCYKCAGCYRPVDPETCAADATSCASIAITSSRPNSTLPAVLRLCNDFRLEATLIAFLGAGFDSVVSDYFSLVVQSLPAPSTASCANRTNSVGDTVRLCVCTDSLCNGGCVNSGRGSCESPAATTAIIASTAVALVNFGGAATPSSASVLLLAAATAAAARQP